MGQASAVRDGAPVAPNAAAGARGMSDGAPAVPHAWLFVAVVLVGVALRVWRALHNGPSFDESFTAMAARQPFGDLIDHLTTQDSHPPLDYLLRAPFARAGASDLLLRSPSIVFSCAALALFAWWMHRRSWFGLLATALLSFSTFQVLHGGEARMYALLQLLGIGAAIIAERWFRAPRAWHSWALASILLVALFDHVSGLLLGLGLVALAGLRRDGEAWRLRMLIGAAGLVWAVFWFPTLLEQLDHSWSDWVPRTTPTGVARVVGEQVMTVRGTTWVLLGAVLAGGVVLIRQDARLGRLWLALGVVPFAGAAVVGIASAFLLPRTLTLASWAPVLALAALLDVARQRWRGVGRGLAIGVPVVVLLATSTFLAGKTWDYDLSVDELQHAARPGDVVAVRPARYGILVDWRIGVRGDRPTRVVALPIPDTDAHRVLGAPMSGRIWLLTPVGSTTRFDGYEHCAPPWDDGVTTVICLVPTVP